MFFVCDGLRGDTHHIGQEFVVITDGVVFPIDFFARIIERVCSTHLKYGHVSARGANLFDVCEPNAGLSDDQRVRRRGHTSLCHVGLEIVDRRPHEVDIVTPSCYDRIGFDPRVSSLSEIIHELNPHLRNRVASFRGRSSDERIGCTWNLAASCLLRGRPVITSAGWTFSSIESYLSEIREGEFFRVYLWHLSYPSRSALEI